MIPTIINQPISLADISVPSELANDFYGLPIEKALSELPGGKISITLWIVMCFSLLLIVSFPESSISVLKGIKAFFKGTISMSISVFLLVLMSSGVQQLLIPVDIESRVARVENIKTLKEYGRREVKSGNYQDSLTVYKKLIRVLESQKNEHTLQEEKANAHFLYGISLMKLNKFEGSESSFERALSYSPDDYDTHHYLCYVYLKNESYERALNACDKALTLDSGDDLESRGRTWYYRGVVMESQDRIESALRSFHFSYAILSTDQYDSSFVESKILGYETQLPSKEEVRLILDSKSREGIPVVKSYDVELSEIPVYVGLPEENPNIVKEFVDNLNPFYGREYPLAFCGDDINLLSEDKFPVTLYPVFISNSEEHAVRAKNMFCQDIKVSKDEKEIQVASFLSIESAEQFKSFMEDYFDGVRTGAGQTIN